SRCAWSCSRRCRSRPEAPRSARDRAGARSAPEHDALLIVEGVHRSEVFVDAAVVQYLDGMGRVGAAHPVEAIEAAADHTPMRVAGELDPVAILACRDESAVPDQQLLHVPRDLDAVAFAGDVPVAEALVEGAVAHRRVAGGLLVDLPLQIRRALDHEADSAQATDLGVLCVHQLEAAELLTEHSAVPHDRVSKRVT